MTAPEPREHGTPPSPPDRRGGHPSSQTASAAGRPAALAILCGARRALLRSGQALAAAACLALLAALVLPGATQAADLVGNLRQDSPGGGERSCTLSPDDIWCGIVTVAEIDLGWGLAYGVNHGTGGLAPREFTVGTTRYTIDGVYVEASGNPKGTLTFSLTTSNPLDDGHRDSLVLHVGSDLFVFGSSAYSFFTESYRWSDSGLDWSSEPKVTVRLRTLPELHVAHASATEGDRVEFEVTLSAAGTLATTVDIATSVEPGDTASSSDFTAVPTPLIFKAGETQKTVTVQTTEDTIVEADETFTLRLLNATNATLPADPTATGTIFDNAEAAHVTIAVARASYTAGLDDVVFTLRRWGIADAALEVAVVLTQDQALLSSANLAPTTVRFEPGAPTAELRLAGDLFADHTLTQGATLTATVAPGPGYVRGTPNAASVQMVVANPAVTVRIERQTYTFDENATGADTAVAVIARTEPGVPLPTRPISGVSLRTEEIDGQAQGNGVDFHALSAPITWQPSDFSADGVVFSARREITLVLTDDTIDEPEPPEELHLTLEAASGLLPGVVLRQPDGTACPAAGCRSTVTITDDDAPDEAMPTAAGATWTLTGETMPAAGDTYTYTLTLASGDKPQDEHVGFYVPHDSSSFTPNTLATGSESCAAPQHFCATFSGGTGDTAFGSNVENQGYDTIYYQLADASPHTATATLAIAADTPVDTTVTFGPLASSKAPRADGMTITVIDPRAAEPVITTATPLEVAENTTAVATLQASDAGGGTITWSKGGGADAARFALSRAGVLRFDSAPDYEAPRDKASTNPANGAANNEYVVKVKASNGTADTTLALVVRVRNANDPPSAGTVTIADTPLAVGVALTASVVGIADPDGVSDPLPLSWQWYRRRAGSIETAIAGATSATYTVSGHDVEATLTAQATYTDGGGFANTLASAPSARVPQAGALAHVSIAAERASYTAGLDDAVFTLRRSGSTAAPLSVAVGLTQQRPFLSADTLARRVHFATGNASAELRLARRLFNTALTQGGTLTAAVAPGPGYVPGTPNAASVQMVVADPAVTVRLEQAAYTFAENATGAAVVLVARTEPGVPPPNRSISVFLRTEEIDGQAQGNGIDFRALSAAIAWQPSDFSADEALFTARREITLVLTDDTVDEPDETLQVALETVSGQPSGVALRQPDGTVCPAAGCRSTVTISDDDPADAALSSLALSGIELTPPFDAATLSYSAAVSTGVASTTVSAAARAPASTVEIKPDDADGSAPGHQVALDLAAGASKDITAEVTSADGSASREYTVTVTGVNTDTPLPVLQHIREIGSALTVTNVKAEFEMYLYFVQTPRPVGFTADDVVVYNGEVTAFEAEPRGGSFTWYHTTISVDEGASTVTVAIPANVIEEGNRQAQRTFGVDVEGPAIDLAVSVGVDAVVSGDFTVTITFSEAVLEDPGQHETIDDERLQWDASSDITITNGGLVRSYPLGTSSKRFQAVVHPKDDYEGVLTFTIRAGAVDDEAGNPNATAEFTRRVDTKKPSVTGIDITSTSGRLARLRLCHRRDDHARRPLPRAGDGCRRVAAVLRHQGRRRDPAGRLCVGYGHRRPELLLYGAGGGPGRRRHQLRRRQHRVERCDDPRRREQ